MFLGKALSSSHRVGSQQAFRTDRKEKVHTAALLRLAKGSSESDFRFGAMLNLI